MHYTEHVQKTINFINENLTEEISLKTLADYVHFSPYHFHRLFLLNIGEAPMEHLRRIRLRAASLELLSMKPSITDIAMKYRFESQDGFCRAFKRYYGITPGEYRKLNLKKILENQKSIVEVKSIMYDISIFEKMACTNDDKKEALNTLDKLLEISEKTKCSGLLSLEPEIEIVQPEFFKKSLQLLIDGMEPETLREILQNYALCSCNTGKELLVRILILEGTLAIQQGSSTIVLREKLSSLFGDEFIEEINKHFGLDNESQNRKLDTFIIKSKDKPYISKETSLLEEPFTRMVDRSLQRLLREIDFITLATAISGASGKILVKVLKNISRKLAVTLIDEIYVINTPITSEITESQKIILETMFNLKKQGDIII